MTGLLYHQWLYIFFRREKIYLETQCSRWGEEGSEVLSLPKRRVDKRVYRNMKTRKNALKRGTNEITEKTLNRQSRKNM
jgi:hypothetical protein